MSDYVVRVLRLAQQAERAALKDPIDKHFEKYRFSRENRSALCIQSKVV